MGRQHIANGVLTVRQEKTGITLRLPVHPMLVAAIEATPSGTLTFLTADPATHSSAAISASGSGRAALRQDCRRNARLTAYARRPVGDWLKPALAPTRLQLFRPWVVEESRATRRPRTRNAWPEALWRAGTRWQRLSVKLIFVQCQSH